MKVTYFPGCTLRTKAKDLDKYARKCAEILDVTLEEPDDWQCCGGVFTTSRDEIATKLSSVRALKAASDKNQPLVTVCSTCHNVIKQTNYAMQNDEEFSSRVNNYLSKEENYDGSAKVLHYLELLRDTVGFDKVKEKVVKPLEGKKIAAYYGCLLLRPGKVMQMDDPENPTIMEDLIRALGAEAVVTPYRNECCGSYISLENPESCTKRSTKITKNVETYGADMILTACPMCKYNLEKYGSGVPVVYLTELLAEAFGVKEDENAK
ncbi:MAG: CoB--CoM heterodisulfide reductase iron-sulfur subunit B family protein [Clostridia bacterium]|nr:CoB--CoM heterodisulfide reductase iron-sulfur subunit B family protein [Clostridia bacterium]